MGIEFLVEGTLYVERTTDSQQLLEIKRGEWKLEQVQAEADRLFKLCENAYVNCKLPNEPDVVNINRLVIDILEDYLK